MTASDVAAEAACGQRRRQPIEDACTPSLFVMFPRTDHSSSSFGHSRASKNRCTDPAARRVAWWDGRPPRNRRPVGSGAEHPFLDALRERVLVLDGAFGTWMQGHDLGPDDFGGEALEGCNEYLVLTRPDLVAQMHDEFFGVGVDAVETATFGAFPLVLNEYGIADATFEINQRAAEIAREVAAGHSTPTGGPAS